MRRESYKCDSCGKYNNIFDSTRVILANHDEVTRKCICTECKKETSISRKGHYWVDCIKKV